MTASCEEIVKDAERRLRMEDSVNADEIRARAFRLLNAYESGALGGERMPEDSNPGLAVGSRENLLYFTLPMALNYQRSAYALWESAAATWSDAETRAAFLPECVVSMAGDDLAQRLLKHRLALQPNRHPAIWRRLCETFMEDFGGDVRGLVGQCGNSVVRTRIYFAENKKRLPYLGGGKIMNYWMYVLEQRCGVRWVDREMITVAPDTHVIQSSVRLGILSAAEAEHSDVREIAAERWEWLLKDGGYMPIDFHTPMWLWSRGGFKVDI